MKRWCQRRTGEGRGHPVVGSLQRKPTGETVDLLRRDCWIQRKASEEGDWKPTTTKIKIVPSFKLVGGSPLLSSSGPCVRFFFRVSHSSFRCVHRGRILSQTSRRSHLPACSRVGPEQRRSHGEL